VSDASSQPALILVVEDDAAIQRVMRRALEQEGWLVQIAADEDEVAALDPSPTPALVVLDMNLPGTSGETVAGNLRALYGQRLPVLVVTADAAALARAKSAGSYSFLFKPFEVSQLVVAVRAGLAQNSRLTRDRG